MEKSKKPQPKSDSHAMSCVFSVCAAAKATCSKFLNVAIADPGSPSPVELGQVLTVVRTAIAEQHVKNADAFPAQSEGVVGMMKGGGLKTVGYSKHGHANEPKTFPDCLDGGCRRSCAVLLIDRRWRLPRASSPTTRLPACRTRWCRRTRAFFRHRQCDPKRGSVLRVCFC
jgi:hypothetical protein